MSNYSSFKIGFLAIAVIVPITGRTDYTRTTKSSVFTYYLGSGQSFDKLTQCYIRKITCSRASDLNDYTFPTAMTWASGGSARAKTPIVKKINPGVLSGNSNLQKVTIPWSITTIGQPCFKGCANLTSISILGGNSTTEYNSWDGVLYNGKFTILKKYPEGKTGTTFTVPSTVTQLGTCCLINTKLSSVYFQGDAPAYKADSFTDSHFVIYYPQGKSGWTNPFNGRPAYAIPSAVTGLSSEIDASNDYVYLYWNPNDVATSYIIYRATSSSTAKVQIATTSSCNYKDTTATPGTTYWYSVSAVNESCVGASSTSVQGRRKAMTYAVTYASGAYGIGDQVSDEKIHNVALTLKPAIFTRNGYSQAGWSTKDDGLLRYALGGSYTDNAATTLYPAWMPNTYTITYAPGSFGTGPQQTAKKAHDRNLTILGETFTRDGYTQTGWSTSDGGNQTYALGSTYTGNIAITLYPSWGANEYSIHFNANGGTGTMENKVAKYDAIVVVPECEFSRTGYVFAGWATNATDKAAYGSGEAISNLTSIANGTIKFFATWEELNVSTPTISPKPGSIFKTDSCNITLSCATVGATIYYSVDGSSPRAMVAFKYFKEFTISTTTTIKAFAVKDGVKSGLLTALITKVDPTPATFTTALSATNIGPIVSGGDADWVAIPDETAPIGEVSVRSGAIENRESTYLETKVKGAGTLTFWWKTSCEPDEWGSYTYDHVTLIVDNVPTLYQLDGNSGWVPVRHAIRDGGEHTIRWVYSTDAYAAPGYEDCAWVNGVTWSGEDWSTIGDPIPDLGKDPTMRQITDALRGSADAKLANNITNGIVYGQYRDWASKVKVKGCSSAAGRDAVKNASNAWLSFALGSKTLIETAPTDGDLKIDDFKPISESRKFDFTVSLKDVEVGSDAAADNLKKIICLEGGTTLEPGGLSSENVSITFGTPENGKVKFTAGPKNPSNGIFFMKVRMSP